MTIESPAGKIFGAKAAVVIGAVMVAGFAALSVQTAREKASRSELESFNAPSAVGDPVVFTLSENGWEGALILKRDGVDLFARRTRGSRDAEMQKAGMDDGAKIPLYRRWKRKQLEEEYYVKLGPNLFLELTATAPKKSNAAPPVNE